MEIVAPVIFEKYEKESKLTNFTIRWKTLLIRCQGREPLPRRVDGCCIIV